MSKKLGSDAVLGVIILVVFVLFVVAAAVYNYWPVSMSNLRTEPLTQEECERYADAMEVRWKFDQEFGCLIIPPGTWKWVSLGERFSLNDVLSTAQP